VARGRPDPFGLRDRIVVVTGATRGIGRAAVDALGAAGARVVVASRKERDCARVADAVARRHRVEALPVACDVTEPKSVSGLFRSVRAWRKGPVHSVLCVAGHPIVPRLWDEPLHRLTPEEAVAGYRQVAAVDLQGSRLCTYYALPDMIKSRRGSFVYVSSTPALAGYKGGPYTEAKAALLGLMRDVARGYGPRGVRANAVAPGNIRTDWLDRLTASERRALERENPLQRFGDPREVADLLVYLAGERSSFVTGQTIVIDGGTVSH
jgi:NAD(P)-dependent dehydrogenase (short-subunit alcohol dehydrogenase family)